MKQPPTYSELIIALRNVRNMLAMGRDVVYSPNKNQQHVGAPAPKWEANQKQIENLLERIDNA